MEISGKSHSLIFEKVTKNVLREEAHRLNSSPIAFTVKCRKASLDIFSFSLVMFTKLIHKKISLKSLLENCASVSEH